MQPKKYKHLTKKQRIEISVLLKTGESIKSISELIGVHRSTIYREITRNKRPRGTYQADYAEELAKIRKERFAKNRKLNGKIKEFIREKLEKYQWSPEQIKGYCKNNNIEMVSHQRIYRYIEEDKAEGGSLYKHLRTGNKRRKKKYGKASCNKAIINNKVSIEKRPDVINKKERIGDWEIDTIVGKNHKGAILTAVERKTNLILMRKLKSKNSEEVAREIVRLLAPYKDKVDSITSDNGTEFSRWEYVARKLEAEYYFAHPYSSWERGLNEYSNKLIRQYIPKKSDFDNIDDSYILRITDKLNKRPRKLLGFRMPIDLFFFGFD